MVMTEKTIRDLAKEVFRENLFNLGEFPNSIIPIHVRDHHIFYVDITHNRIDVYFHDNDDDAKSVANECECYGSTFQIVGHYN